MKFLKQFGGGTTPERLERYAQSVNWEKGKFRNLEHTSMGFSPLEIPKLLYKQFTGRKEREPKAPIPILPFDKETFLAPSDKAKMIWYGHSVVLMRIANKTILIDPMLGSDASPVGPFSIKRFSQNTLELINNFPEIDYQLMTHDHYDHIDLDSFEKLRPKVKHYITTLGTGRHYESWGISPTDITELDWWDHITLDNGIQLHCTPSRHFSGRGLRDRQKSLWGGWVIKTKAENIYFSGDGGYGAHFKEVGDRLGPFDFGFIECGQYNKLWHQIHLFPEESVSAAQDAKVKNIMPVHWAGFALAQHHWTEPVERFVQAAEITQQDYCTPKLGEIFTADYRGKEVWWKSL